MSHQERSWVETVDEASGRARWNVLVNGTPVPGGYVVQLGEDAFEAHYPHMEPFVRATLAEAQERLSWAPPITAGVAHIGSPVEDDPQGFAEPQQAAEELGVSVWRVNAMVANGKLDARRRADGSTEVSRSSLAGLASAEAAAAQAGAHEPAGAAKPA